MLLAAYAIGASQAFFYTNETYVEARESIRRALEEAQAEGWIGDGILGTNFSIAVESRAAPTPYVAGEDTAVLEGLEGRAPLPRQKPPYPVTAGLFGQPTLVNNVETIANIAPIAPITPSDTVATWAGNRFPPISSSRVSITTGSPTSNW